MRAHVGVGLRSGLEPYLVRRPELGSLTGRLGTCARARAEVGAPERLKRASMHLVPRASQHRTCVARGERQLLRCVCASEGGGRPGAGVHGAASAPAPVGHPA